MPGEERGSKSGLFPLALLQRECLDPRLSAVVGNGLLGRWHPRSIHGSEVWGLRWRTEQDQSRIERISDVELG